MNLLKVPGFWIIVAVSAVVLISRELIPGVKIVPLLAFALGGVGVLYFVGIALKNWWVYDVLPFWRIIQRRRKGGK